MRHPRRLGALAAVVAGLAILGGLINVQAAGSNADYYAVDLDTTGNTSTSLGTRDECREVTANSDVIIDITIANVPAGADAMIGYSYELSYNASVMSVTAKDTSGLLSTAAGYAPFDAGDTVPDTISPYVADVLDTGAAGVSGSGFLQRLTFHIAAGAAPGGYSLAFNPAGNNSYPDTVNNTHFPDERFGARLAVGVTCASLTPKQGDVDCSGGASPVGATDALKVLRYVAGLTVVQNEPCADIGTGAAPLQMGNVDCSIGANPVTATDALKILRFVAGLTVVQTEPCNDIGT